MRNSPRNGGESSVLRIGSGYHCLQTPGLVVLSVGIRMSPGCAPLYERGFIRKKEHQVMASTHQSLRVVPSIVALALVAGTALPVFADNKAQPKVAVTSAKSSG